MPGLVTKLPPQHKCIREVAFKRTSVYEKWPPEGISQAAAREVPATMQMYTRSGLQRLISQGAVREASATAQMYMRSGFRRPFLQGAVREAPARTTTMFERLAQEAQDRLRPSCSCGNVPEITALGPARVSGRFLSQCHVLKHGQLVGSSWAALAWLLAVRRWLLDFKKKTLNCAAFNHAEYNRLAALQAVFI